MKKLLKNKITRKIKTKKKIIKKVKKEVPMKKVWRIKMKTQYWHFDYYSDARTKLKSLLDTGAFYGTLEYKNVEVKE